MEPPGAAVVQRDLPRHGADRVQVGQVRRVGTAGHTTVQYWCDSLPAGPPLLPHHPQHGVQQAPLARQVHQRHRHALLSQHLYNTVVLTTERI